MPRLRVVIPAIDEASHLPQLLDDLARQRDIAIHVLVADGGSRDATRAVSQAHGASWLATSAGRAAQMNAGAALGDEPWLLFLHADSRLLKTDQLARAIAKLSGQEGPVAGHFALSFETTGRRRGLFLYRFMAAKTRTNREYTINGDQGLLLSRALFAQVGGYNARQPFLEDQRIIAALATQARIVCLGSGITTSPRRFETEGRWRRYALMGLIMAMHIADVPAFFEQAPRVYARQADTARLALGDYWRLVCRLAREEGEAIWQPRLRCLAAVFMQQSWQGALAIDVALGRDARGSGPVSRWHDRVLAPRLAGSRGELWVFTSLAMAVFGPRRGLRLAARERRRAHR